MLRQINFGLGFVSVLPSLKGTRQATAFYHRWRHKRALRLSDCQLVEREWALAAKAQELTNTGLASYCDKGYSNTIFASFGISLY